MHGRILRNWCAKISTIILSTWIQNSFIFFYASFKRIFRLDVTRKSYASGILIVIPMDRCILNLLHHGFPSGNPEDDRSGTRRTKAPTVVHRLDEILKEIRHWRSSGPRWPSPSIHPTSLTLLAEPLKYSSYQYLPSLFLFSFSFFFRGRLVDSSLPSPVSRVLSSRQQNNAVSSLSIRQNQVYWIFLLISGLFRFDRSETFTRLWLTSPRKTVSSRWIRSTPCKYNSWQCSRSALRNARENMFINA